MAEPANEHPQATAGSPHKALTLKPEPGEVVRVRVEADAGYLNARVTRWADRPPVERAGRHLLAGWRTLIHSPARLTLLAVALAAVVLWVGLQTYPAFGPDEALASIRATALVESGLKDDAGRLLPAFFLGNGEVYALGASVYLALLLRLLGLTSLFALRSLTALLSLLSVSALAWSLYQTGRFRFAFALPAFLAGVPLWAYFARTGLPAAQGTAFAAGALACYLLYRQGRVGFLFGAVLLAWLAFYSSPSLRFSVPIAVLLLLVVDGRYHLSQRETVLPAVALAILLAAPLINFWVTHPGFTQSQLAALNSAWSGSLPLGSKLSRLGENLLDLLAPRVWFTATPTPEAANLGFIPAPLSGWLLLPALAGLLRSALGFRRAPFNRALLAAWLAALLGASFWRPDLADLLSAGLALLLFAFSGLEWGFSWVTGRPRLPNGLAGWVPTWQ